LTLDAKKKTYVQKIESVMKHAEKTKLHANVFAHLELKIARQLQVVIKKIILLALLV